MNYFNTIKDICNTKLDSRNEYDVADYRIRLIDLIEMKNLNLIEKYEKSRGEFSINRKRVEEMKKNFNRMVLGLIPLAFSNKINKFIQYDFHHRVTAALELYNESGLSKGELNFPIFVRVMHEEMAIRYYRDINKTEKHTNVQKLTNTDLAGGHFISKIGQKYGFDFSRNTFKKPVVFAAYCISNNLNNLDYKEIKKEEDTVNNCIEKLSEEKMFSWNEKHEEKLVNALKKVHEVRNFITSNFSNGMATQNIVKFLRSSQVFSLMLFDAMRDEPIIFSLSSRRIAERIIRNDTDIWNALHNLSQRHYKRVCRFYNLLGVKFELYSDLQTKANQEAQRGKKKSDVEDLSITNAS